MKKSSMNLPNTLSLLRCALVPVFVVTLFWMREIPLWGRIVPAIVYLITGLTDMLDGKIARKYNLVTDFGKFLDPLADKLLICAILVEMVGLGWVPAWIVNIIIIRELAVTGLRAVAADKGVVIAADWYGKWKTTFQIIAMVPLLIHYDFMGIPMHTLGSLILYIALVLTIFSGCNYFYQFYREWRASVKGTL